MLEWKQERISAIIIVVWTKIRFAKFAKENLDLIELTKWWRNTRKQKPGFVCITCSSTSHNRQKDCNKRLPQCVIFAKTHKS